MLKQRHSTSALSSKTLSRPKFINNKTLQQPHNISTESGKQTRTLRNQPKNKSCFIPKHLVQSTQSHLVCSNERMSNQYKSTAKHYSTQHFNPNVSHNVSKNNILQSKLTIGDHPTSGNNQSHPNPHQPTQNMLYSYQPYLSLSTEHNPKPRLSHHNPHIPQILLQQQQINTSSINPTSQLVKQKLLSKQVQQMFLHKNKQLTKVLQEMHRFCISVNELKWICEEVAALISKYNHDIKIYYQEYFDCFQPKTDLDNIAHQAQQLLKRFNQLAYLNSQQHPPLFNFKLLLNHNTSAPSQEINNSIFTEHQSIQQQNHKNKSVINQVSNSSPSHPSSSPQNPHSWSKLIANLQQQQIPKPFPNHNQLPLIPSEQNSKNFTIRTFQITQNNSPFKNKTLNELIRLSELRKTEFDTQNKQNNQLQSNNQHPQIEHKNRFAKKQVSSYIDSKLMSTQKDPFDSIHLPHFSTKPVSDERSIRQNEKNMRQSQKSFNQTQKNYYENEITLLKKQLDNVDKQNNDYFRKLRQKNKQIEKENDRLKQKMALSEEKFSNFERQVYILVEQALNQLLMCGKVNNHGEKTSDKYLNAKCYGKSLHGYEQMQVSEIVKTKPIQRSEPYMMIGNKSFFSLVNSLEQVFKLQQSLDQTNNLSANNVKRDLEPKRHDTKTQRATSINMHNDKTCQQQQQQVNSLNEQIIELQKVKTALSTQILKLQQQFNSYPRQIDIRKSSNYQLSQMLFAQAFTIQEILQLNDSHQQQTQNYN